MVQPGDFVCAEQTHYNYYGVIHHIDNRYGVVHHVDNGFEKNRVWAIWVDNINKVIEPPENALPIMSSGPLHLKVLTYIPLERVKIIESKKPFRIEDYV